ncbi:hypothetical protein MACH09_04650 [Vibrio sp. MACH09]|uniref:START domain-containing protein n=1 Tax=Vibrio sp. MACH09 TaxID=3025122 RepID=UPI002790148B|nr:START domain-containing protein [Vibrio sp. MACH09]GLO59957.1 hypothetical protein MACH09_04650 [Vibrio sp. MACH09]
MLTLKKCLFITLLLVTTPLLAEPFAYWKFDSNRNGISIYSREHSDGLVEIRAQMFTPTSYGAFLSLLEDSKNVPNWIANVSSSQVLKQISATENIVYTQFAAPWPATNRDMVTYSKYSIEDSAFTLSIKDAPLSTFPPQQGYVRIHSVTATWLLQKLTNGLTVIEYTAFAHPGGDLPDWLINKLAIESARETFEGLRAQLPNYQTRSHPQIQE